MRLWFGRRARRAAARQADQIEADQIEAGQTETGQIEAGKADVGERLEDRDADVAAGAEQPLDPSGPPSPERLDRALNRLRARIPGPGQDPADGAR